MLMETNCASYNTDIVRTRGNSVEQFRINNHKTAS